MSNYPWGYSEPESLDDYLDRLVDGDPCFRTDCLSHVTHPCDGCGRIAGYSEDSNLTEEQLREIFKATNTAEPLIEGWPGLLRYGRAVAAAERKYYRDAIKKASGQISGALCYHTMEANHEQLKDAVKTLADAWRSPGAQPGTAGTSVGCTAGDGG